MERKVLIDTSAWVQFIRSDGDDAIADHISELMLAGRAAWCHFVRFELWRGTKSDHDRNKLKRLELEVGVLPIDDAVWNLACELGMKCRRQGTPLPAGDTVIFACAHLHGAELFARDKHFDRLEKLASLNES